MKEYYIHKHDKLIEATFDGKMTPFHMIFFHECLIQQLTEGRTTVNANQLGTEYSGYSKGTTRILESLQNWTEVEFHIEGEEPMTLFNSLKKGKYDGTIEFELNPKVLKYVKVSYE